MLLPSQDATGSASSSAMSSFDVTEDVVTVRAGQVAHLVCESTGSRPQAELTWIKNGDEVDEDFVTYTSPTVPTSRVKQILPECVILK